MNLGICWAFAVVDTIQIAYRVLKGGRVHLSVQELVDYCPEENDEKCKGHGAKRAFRYIIKNGIAYDSEYPFVGCRIEIPSKPEVFL